MAAKTKADLIAVTEKEFAKLQTVLEGVDETLATTPHPQDKITIKDTILHRVHWLNLFFKWRRDGDAGKTVAIPAPGYKWNQLKEYNAKIREETHDVPWSKALSRLKQAHKKFLTLINELDENTLYGASPYDWTNKWTLGRWAESSGPSHYRSAAKYIREIKKKAG